MKEESPSYGDHNLVAQCSSLCRHIANVNIQLSLYGWQARNQRIVLARVETKSQNWYGKLERALHQ